MSPSTEIRDEFEKVNNSLTTSHSALDSSVKSLYFSIDTSKLLTPTLKLKADSIYNSTMDVYRFIDSVQGLMKKQDSSGADLTLAENTFINSSAGNILATKLQSTAHNIGFHVQ